ncbi:MAG TPA: DsbA family protein [Acidimicrobiales bacterium]|nr:DsbA family protein [Acidimicrobiales bacterium]
MQVIEVFADIWCPFTHVGLKTVADQLRIGVRPDARIWVRAWPLEWVNGRAMDPMAALTHAQELREQISAELFSRFDASSFPRSTIPALATAVRAYRHGLEVGESLSLEIRDSLFERGEDVGDPDVLRRIRKGFGVPDPDPDDYATVAAEWKEGRDRGVLGSPHFFCGDSSVFCPSLDIAKTGVGEGRVVERNVNRLGAFLRECLTEGRQK